MHLSISKFLQPNFPQKSVLSLSNAIVGVSVLSMPYCYHQCGIILATLLMIISALITSYSCKILISSAHASNSATYEYLALRAMGRTMKLIVELSSIGLLLGSIVAYQMIVGDLGSVVVAQALDMTNSQLIRGLVILILTFTISFPLSLSERFDHLTPISIQSIIFYLFFGVYSFVQCGLNSTSILLNMNKIVYWRWSGIFVSLPIISLSFSCQTMLFVVFSELSDATSHAMNDIIDLSVAIVGLMYFIAGIFGYLAFLPTYEFIPGNVMQIFPKNIFQQIFLWGFILNCTTGIPFMVNPTRISLYTLWNDQQQQSLFGERHIIPRRLIIIFTAIVVFLPTIIAIFIPNLEFVLALTGATSGQLICYILPAIIALHVMPHGLSILKTKVLMIIGIISLVICTIMTFKTEFVDNNVLSSSSSSSLLFSSSSTVITMSITKFLKIMNSSATNFSDKN
ncbi:unnamed protein product [Rotaria magnacalcarata]|uniref:Amino acid transporter transmembrane domain-containing protein n=1 Tax=Rotaria magnacalcarata TaxID=392030 RepID=A0A814YM80_9BILA|nr:unnamed protein product [Rotaria magnacalcarata]CAF1668443.1 unnamed protein product [Rotaria magnacalcarata]CAF2047356.1 unnamed protein product [Rotaria magnacalcarata]CAF2151332.1 unnamed protein product [Rotaria magnacalcarata]CAF2185337.1 unnamed protein product [Rotaria magnacalcarata]